MPNDFSILGIAFAILLFIIIFSAIVLYLAFRIKETFREEKKRGVRVAKIAFLIGILFFAGASFYFFAQTLNPPPEPTPTQTPTPTTSPSPTPTPTPTSGEPQLSLSVSHPPTVRTNTKITISFAIVNPTEYIAHDVVIQTKVLLEYFTIISSTHEVIGNTVKIGDVEPGTTVSSLELNSPERPQTVQDTTTLIFKEMRQPVIKEISITVRGGP